MSAYASVLMALAIFVVAALVLIVSLFRDCARRQAAMTEEERIQEWLDGQW